MLKLWKTVAKFSLYSLRGYSEIKWLFKVIFPSCGSHNLKINFKMVDFPAPFLPTIATFWPGKISKSIFFNSNLASLLYLKDTFSNFMHWFSLGKGNIPSSIILDFWFKKAINFSIYVACSRHSFKTSETDIIVAAVGLIVFTTTITLPIKILFVNRNLYATIRHAVNSTKTSSKK